MKDLLIKKPFVESGDMIHSDLESGVKVFKARLSSCTNRGKSYGFRVIYIYSKTSNSVYFIYAYPKYGPKGISNVSSTFIVSLLENVGKEKINNELNTLTFPKGKLIFEPIIYSFEEQGKVIAQEDNSSSSAILE